MLTNIHDPPSEGNFRDENGNAIKPTIVADYNRHMGYVDKANRLANSYTASRGTWKWTKKTLFPPVKTWPFSTVTSCCLHVERRKSHIEIFYSPLSGRCWHGLHMNPNHPGLYEDLPSADRIHDTTSNGPQPDQEVMSHVFSARCNANGKV
jgi:hypothetical protein